MHHTLFRTAALIVASVGCAFAFLLLSVLSRVYVQAAVQVPLRTTTLRHSGAAADLPVRLTIPAIGVDAIVESVGRTTKGEMDVPKDVDNVGWYSLGVRPGEKGSAVFAGHLDWYDGKTAVFQHLGALRIGDMLSVETARGKVMPYVVREIRTFESDEHAQAVFAKSDESHVNLITCGGAWDIFQKMYTERLVVFTDAVGVSVEPML